MTVCIMRWCPYSRCALPRDAPERKALVGFQGRGCADVVQPNCCHPVLLEALLFQWPYIRRCVSRTMVEHQTPESNKSDEIFRLGACGTDSLRTSRERNIPVDP